MIRDYGICHVIMPPDKSTAAIRINNTARPASADKRAILYEKELLCAIPRVISP
jgi:hypothetical protein